VLFATVLALSSAGLHATWNLLIKTSDDRELAAWAQFVAGGVIFLPVLVVEGLPERDALPFIVASAVVHVLYVHALTTAYHHGDFSLAYPLARGGGALTAALLGVLFLDDNLPGGAWFALVIVAVGLASLVQPGAPPAELGYAVLTAIVIGTYTVIDTAGARHTDSGFVYACTLVPCTALALSAVGIGRGRGTAFVQHVRATWSRALFSGFCLTMAYALVLVAVRHAPVGYVATLRESSVVLGAVLGWLFLHEALGRRRTISSIVVTVGLVALIAFG
jgi:drug/metabolite transporter (DMT)-like permease